MTGLPFVWSFWVGRPQTVQSAHMQALHSARFAGTPSLDTIVATHRFRNAAQAAIARSYLHDNLRFELTEDGRTALERFYTATLDIRLLEPVRARRRHVPDAGRGVRPGPLPDLPPAGHLPHHLCSGQSGWPWIWRNRTATSQRTARGNRHGHNRGSGPPDLNAVDLGVHAFVLLPGCGLEQHLRGVGAGCAAIGSEHLT